MVSVLSPTAMFGFSRTRVLFGLGACLSLASVACNEEPLQQAPTDGGAPVVGLSADQAGRIVARVGDRAITLGDFAKTIERMDQFDRLKYQSKERRRELLEEMIDVELLAAEAKRRGLDKDPEAADALRMIMRDALLAEARGELPSPGQINEKEVRAYFEAHADRFNEPERRRVSVIAMKDKKEAEKVLKEALKAKSPKEWGELFYAHSLTAVKPKGPPPPPELAGDLGIVGPMSDPRGGNPKVPEAVREAAFKLRAVNEVAADIVEAEGRFFIVRLNGLTAPHRRTLTEADRSIRVLLLQEQMTERERALEEELKKKFPVEIDTAALATVKLPVGIEKTLAQADGEESDAGAAASLGEPPQAVDGGH